jgi:hypothetical protein
MEDLLVLKGHKCGYCGKPSVAVPKSYFNKNFGPGIIYACLDCNATVGVHKGSDKPLGRLAKPELRLLKMQAHKYFDPIWLTLKVMTRVEAYAWLCAKMETPPEFTHIGMFNEEQCRNCIDVCQTFLLKELDFKSLLLKPESL